MEMKKKYAGLVRLCVAALATGLTLSCADDWDAHYDGASRPTQTLWQEIASRPELAEFAALLKEKGYDKYLDSDQRYTVWAPAGTVNTSLVAGGEMTADEVMEQVVENHIARGIIPASSVVNDTIRVLNGKPMGMVAEGGVTNFNGAPIRTANIECSNGNLHILASQAGYNHNVWSYLRQDADMSRVADYLYSFNKMVFDASASTPGGVVGGQQVYVDSVFVLNNELWSQIGYLNNEWRRYTMLVPGNDCWDRLMASFRTYFNYNTNGGDDEAAEDVAGKYASRKLADALVFDMARQNPLSEYWISTGGIRFLHPEEEGGLFYGTEAVTCSNGVIRKASDVALDPADVLMSEIVIEAENYGDYLVDGNYYDKENDRAVFVAAANSGVSSNYYMKFTPSSMLRGPVVTYALPGVLSARYDVGVVFIPVNLTRNGWSSTIDPKKSRVDFELRDGYTGESYTLDGVEIPGDKVDTVWVEKGHSFPYCDYYPERLSMEDAPITLTISSKAKRNESGYTRDLYIDCIVLKPTVNEDLNHEE